VNDALATTAPHHEHPALVWGAIVLVLLAAQVGLGCALSLVWR
jgi:hypothetical protein